MLPGMPVAVQSDDPLFKAFADLLFAENERIARIYFLSSTYKCNFLGADNKQ